MEWTVVTVIIALVGLLGTVAVPLMKNTKAMTQLSEQLKHLAYRINEDENDLSQFKEKSSNRHKKIFACLEENQKNIINHEGRITALENHKNHIG